MTYESLLLLLVIVCITSMVGYRRFAKRWRLVDVPNSRSSHHKPTLRGSGIIFLPLLCVAWLYSNGTIPSSLFFGILVAGFTGFADDIRGLSAGIRALGYMVALTIAATGLGISWSLMPLWAWVLWLIVSIGIINAWNFMDGINGITVLYSSVVILSLWIPFHMTGISGYTPLFLAVMIGLCGATWMNVRPRAVAFLGDVGSVFLGIVIALFLTLLIATTGEAGYILFVLIYGMDTVLTIAERLLRKENIFKAHRTHLYQYLANEHRWPHLKVSFLYAGIQAAINTIVIIIIQQENAIGIRATFWMILLSAIIFILVKRRIMQRAKVKP